MTAGHVVTTSPGHEHVEVRLDGELLAATDRPVRLEETGLPTRYYLPPEDVRMDRLTATSFHTTCPFKGEASYWSVGPHDGVAWAYQTPKPAAVAVTGMLTFYPDRVEMTVDGRRLDA